MAYRFLMHKRASKQLSKLPADVDQRIQRKLREMVTDEFRELMEYDVQPIRGVSYDVYRTRIGGYRVFFVVEAETVAILHVDEREGAYGNTGVLDERASEFL